MIRPFLLCAVVALGPGMAASAGESQDNAELGRLFAEDQADRTSPDGGVRPNIDWQVVGARDEAREKRVKELISANELATGADYYHAAMVLQHATEPDDYLLAHDLCVIAIGKGDRNAKWLAAASLDRFLINIGRPQRFGTQYQSKRPGQPPRLVPVEPSVPDSLRAAFNAPTLEQAKAKESAMAKIFEKTQSAPSKP